jgi:hypothetical protein
LRSADFSAHEGLMQQLQYREKARAWTTMVMPQDDGMPRGIEARIRDGLVATTDREALTKELWSRMRTIKNRLGSRMGHMPADDWYLSRIHGLQTKTLQVLVETGSWITREIGGDEISVDVEFPVLDAPSVVAEPVPAAPARPVMMQIDAEQTVLKPMRDVIAAQPSLALKKP